MVADAAPAPEEIDGVVTAVLRASRVLVGVSARSLEAVEDQVTVVQFRTLVVLHTHGTVNLGRLAALLGVNSSTALRSIDRLMTVGLASRTENPSSRREVLLGLTPEGAQLVRRVTARRRREIATIVREIAPERREDLIEALRTFADVAGEPAAESDAAAALGW